MTGAKLCAVSTKPCGPGCADACAGAGTGGTGGRWAEMAKPRGALPALDGAQLLGERAKRRTRSVTAPVPVRAKTQFLQAVPIKTLELTAFGLG